MSQRAEPPLACGLADGLAGCLRRAQQPGQVVVGHVTSQASMQPAVRSCETTPRCCQSGSSCSWPSQCPGCPASPAARRRRPRACPSPASSPGCRKPASAACRVLGVDLSAPSALDVGRRAAAQAALKAALNVTGRTGSDYRSRVWSLVAIESIIWVLNFPQKPPSLAVICAWVRLFLNQEEIYEVL